VEGEVKGKNGSRGGEKRPVCPAGFVQKLGYVPSVPRFPDRAVVGNITQTSYLPFSTLVANKDSYWLFYSYFIRPLFMS
jgi:hypothetical protein